MNNLMASYAVKLNLWNNIADNNDTHSIAAEGGVDGAPGHISSLRAESRGAIAILIILHILCKRWPDKITKFRKQVTVYFDSTAVIARSEADPTMRHDF